jgi:hypothetical protein
MTLSVRVGAVRARGARLRRNVSGVAVAAAMLAFASPVPLATLAPAAHAQAAPAKYAPPRTSWGKPDMQGIWSNASVTRMERPKGYPLVLSREQADQLEGKALINVRSAQKDASYVDPNAPPPEKGKPLPPVGNYDVAYTDPGKTVANINGELRSSYVTFPEDGRIPALTEAGKKMRAVPRRLGTGYDNPEERGLSERCVFMGTNGPPFGNYLYNNNFQIVETPNNLMIMSEMIHDVRIARIGGKHRTDGVEPWMGDSIAHWDGDTLVVETTHINPAQRVGAVMLSDTGKVTERFTRISDSQILYEFEIDDPATYTQVWRGQMPLTRLKDPLYEYACHEGNYGLQDILKGGRTDDKSGVSHTGGGSRGE